LKQFVILSIISLAIFSGCSSHFERYTPSSEQERASTSYKNVRILEEGRSKIVLSTVYLNDVYPKYTDGLSHFLISFYNDRTHSALIFDTNETNGSDKYTVLLNGEIALFAEELDSEDLLIDLLPIKIDWSKYYYIRFNLSSGAPKLELKDVNTTLSLTFIQKARNKTYIKQGAIGSH